MAKELVMPKLGLTMEEGTIVKWYLSEGDKFKKGDFIFSVETEKLTNDVEANEDGEIEEILVEEGETVKVKTPVAKLVGWEEDESSKKAEKKVEVETESKAEKSEKKDKSDRKERKGRRVMAAPKARKIAADNNIKLEDAAEALGRDRLSVADIEKYLSDVGKAEDKTAKKDKEVPKESGMRNVIARRLTESWRAPHIYLRREIEVDELLVLKKNLKEKGKDISFNDLISYVAVKALEETKKLNMVVDEEGRGTVSNKVNLGLAVAVDEGLLVPVVKNAEELSLKQLAEKSKDLITRTRENRLNLDELEGGTFTITNLGMFGIDEFTAIINPPQAAILAVGTIKNKLYLNEEGLVREKKIINFTLGVDHRAVDGAAGAEFMQKFAEFVEEPYLMF
ncbi:MULTISPECIES: dihydrolipoamide acetyltransferase family protein [unclassified Halanaerobium]|jgi:pyruvate dehydrogenase E2 component (dihydrolipoamide acetyltransferase)|uniref:dihydrolipoamide acetyltransferase family protein n=1 Tax=unclassified Halanaerobium TaxID=2641197 RepID=UPI000DF4960C|nr:MULTISPECIES: dihydrolipoamide acetyltransferase family protein [unclassified Halanaerobium]RCW44126.1 pyruvate dehydrogenase E2 component (dihydrolipoamide acetyltransferase) [Halanaerobium sp. MA284_MarDTE_T2]RCW86984.1 pyruvate dehydrogenase E2 component (dihydrolipoamide acetyltransferase) [Halanaerobium sp. DL-01]